MDKRPGLAFLNCAFVAGSGSRLGASLERDKRGYCTTVQLTRKQVEGCVPAMQLGFAADIVSGRIGTSITRLFAQKLLRIEACSTWWREWTRPCREAPMSEEVS